MARARSLTPLLAVALAAAPAPARADSRYRLSGFFGARLFSDDSALGTPTRTSLSSSVGFGLRVARALRGPLALEGELPLVLTGSRDDRALVLMFDPRVHALLEGRINARLRPFGLLGVGLPTTLSSNRPALASDLQPEVYLGAGAKFPRRRGWSLRVDVRVALLPARGDALVTPEVEVFVGLFRWTTVRRLPTAPLPEEMDTDGDGLDDAADRCPTRAEDADHFKDEDGCPDIDDDGDEVLDIADKCRLEAETWNGYQDDDGCPDSLPTDVRAIAGVIPGLTFAPGSAVLGKAAHKPLDRLAKVLLDNPSVRGRLIGHTDDRGSTDDRLDLSQRRAQSVKFYLVARGVDEDRLGAVGMGNDAPLVPNDSPGARVKNNRVEFEIRRRD
jgi:OOP family OmpA-OmpF porin